MTGPAQIPFAPGGPASLAGDLVPTLSVVSLFGHDEARNFHMRPARVGRVSSLSSARFLGISLGGPATAVAIQPAAATAHPFAREYENQ
jgi:hypothetical protein